MNKLEQAIHDQLIFTLRNETNEQKAKRIANVVKKLIGDISLMNDEVGDLEVIKEDILNELCS